MTATAAPVWPAAGYCPAPGIPRLPLCGPLAETWLATAVGYGATLAALMPPRAPVTGKINGCMEAWRDNDMCVLPGLAPCHCADMTGELCALLATVKEEGDGAGHT